MSAITAIEKTTGMVLYAIAQSRDDRTMDIYSSEQDELVSDYTERQRIMQLIEDNAPVSDTKTIVFRSRKDWASGYLLPDSPGPNGRLRPVQFIAQSISWKTADAAVFADAVCKATTTLVGPDEMSSETLDTIRHRLRKLVNRKKRFLGCLPMSFGIIFFSIVLLWLLLRY